jgi:hypothetical protein
MSDEAPLSARGMPPGVAHWFAPPGCPNASFRGPKRTSQGNPYPGRTAYLIESKGGGYDVLKSTTERRNEPLESLRAFFTCIDDAGKYIVLNIGDSLRIDCRIDPIYWAWEDSGLDPRVTQTSLGEYVSKFELKEDPNRYFVLQAGGIQPENRLLPLTYDELDGLLLDGMPESVLSRLGD